MCNNVFNHTQLTLWRMIIIRKVFATTSAGQHQLSGNKQTQKSDLRVTENIHIHLSFTRTKMFGTSHMHNSLKH